MTKSPIRSKKWLKYLSRFLLAMLLLLGIFFATIWYLATSNAEIVREKVAALLEQQLGTEAAFSSYHISNTDYFPFLAVQIKDLNLKGAGYDEHQKELLRIDQLTFLFHPFDVLQQKYTINKITADGLTLQLYTDTMGLKNTRLLFPAADKNKKQGRPPVLDIDQLTLKNSRFDLTNDQRRKHHRFTIQEGILHFSDQDTTLHIQLDMQCLFEGLLFKEEKGAFLKDQQLGIKSTVAIDKKNKILKILPSQVRTEQDDIQLDGQLTLADTNHLHLEFKTDGLLLDHARPLLNQGINKTLKEIHIDQPIEAHFVLDGPTIPGKLIPATLDFFTESSTLKFQEHRLEDMKLAGRFENNCMKIDREDTKNGCLYITEMSGRYGGDIPFDLSAKIKNLEDAEHIKLKAKARAPLPVMQRFFGDLPQLQLQAGELVGEFEFEGNPVSYLWNCQTCNDHQLNGRLSLVNAELSYSDQLTLQSINGQVDFDQQDVKINQLDLNLNDLETRLNGKVKNAVQKFIGNPTRLAADLQLFVDEVNVDTLLASFSKPTAVPSNNDLEPKRLLSDQLDQLTTEINNRLDLRLGIQSDTITYQAYQASDLDLRFEISGDCHRGNLLGEHSCLRISQLKAKVLDGVPIDVSFSLNKSDDPILDINVGGELPLKKIQAYFPVKEVNIQSGNALLQLQASAPLNDFTNPERLLDQLEYNGSLALHDISGEYLPEQQRAEEINGQLKFNKEELNIEFLKFKYADFLPLLSGKVKNYLPMLRGKSESPVVQLALDLPVVDWSKLTAPEKEQGMSQAYQPSDLIALINQTADHLQGELALSVGALRIPEYEMEKCSLLINLSTKEEGGEKIKSVAMDHFYAQLWGNTLLSGQMNIADLAQPELATDLHIQLPVEEMGRVITSRWLRFKDGLADLHLRYQTKIQDSLNANHYLLNADMDGSLTFVSAEIDYTAREFMFNNINGTIDFTEKDLKTSGANFVLNNNTAQVSGSCSDYLEFFILPDRKINFDIELDVPVFDFNYFQTPQDLGLSTDSSSQVSSGSDKFEALLNSGTMELTTRIQQLIYRRFKPQDVFGKIELSADRVGLENLSMSLAEGTFAIQGEISEIARHAPKVNVEATFLENNISTVFTSFDNFGQKDMTDKNIEGYFSAAIKFQSDLNNDYKVLPPSIRGEMDLSIYKGSLIDLPAFRDLSGILFKNRRMYNIGFDTIETTTHLNGLDLLVDYFYIHSTSMDFGVEGRYSFGAGDRTYMIFQVPTGNIFRRYIPKDELSEKDSKRKGFPILIEAKEKKNKLKFKVRLFKKRRKLRRVLERN